MNDSTRLEVGAVAPDFTLPDQDGNNLSLSSFRGKKVIVYFYPKDNTPGCTKEACSLRDHFSAIEGKNAVILGISPDGANAHTNFRNKFNLPFTLLSDPEKAVIKQWGAWGMKTLYGKTNEGLLRTTFIIDEEGKIIKIFRKVKTDIHGEEVLNYI